MYHLKTNDLDIRQAKLDLGNKEEKILEKNLDCYSATLVYQPDRINLSSNILITKENDTV